MHTGLHTVRAGILMRPLPFAGAAWILLFSALNLSGQGYLGGIRGTLRDAGGIIPGATVVLIDEATNEARTTVTNQKGEYAFPNLQPGTYTLRTQVEGFKPFERARLEVGVSTFLVVDVSLEVGSVTESITVTAESPVLNVANASVASSLKSVELTTLPTVSRNPFFLSITTPNVLPSGIPQFTRMLDQNATAALSIAGGPRGANNYTLDGVSITNLLNRAVIIPSIEGIEEVKVQVSTYDAEMGRTGGGVFNTIHRRGSNEWHGSGLIQNRPNWGVGQLYFEKQAGEPKLDSSYWLYAGSAGGPIAREKTFFWAAMEGLHESPTRNTVLILPSAAQARGDFAQSGRTIYDPLTTRPDPDHPGQFVRDPFPGNVIPNNRLNAVGINIAAFLAARGSGALSASANAPADAQQASLNLNHRFNDEYSLSGTYMFYDSTEGFEEYYGGPSEPFIGDVVRRVHLMALNNTILPTPDTVLTFRYGYLSYDDDYRTPDYDPAQLGFSPSFLNQITQNVFPEFFVDGYGFQGGWASDDVRYYSHTVNGTVSKFLGSHTLKLGGDYRRIGVNQFFGQATAGTYSFDAGFTAGPDPNDPDPTSGDSLASLLLGYPSSGYIYVGTPRDQFVNYYGGFFQDDWRVTSSLVLNLGLRVEHETGLREKENRQTVGFDRERPWPVQPIPGMTLRGGLMYAGVDGYPEYQGDPAAIKLGPRIGFAWTLGPSTVLRGGYGVFWAPYQPTSETAYGYEAFTSLLASSDGGLTPAVNLSDPFPAGIDQPQGASQGLLTGAGGDVDFPDQFRKSAHVQQFSMDLEREIPGEVAVSAGYLGSRSDRLGIAGQTYSPVNINQLDPSYFALGTGLQEPVPNPFFGDPLFGALSESPTIARGQLLRPYPQFGNVYALQVSDGRRRYHSVVLRMERRVRRGWGGRINYTWSRTEDNIFGEANFFSNRRGFALNNYDLDREYGRSITDTPHRLNVSGIIELPFGAGKRWLDSGGFWGALLGGWTFSAAGFYQSGFPIAVFQRFNNTGLLGDVQRPDVVPGVDPGHLGSVEENLESYLNPAAWTLARAFSFGNASRTDPRVRTPFRQNWDFAFQKSQPAGRGSVTLRFEVINAFDHPDFGGPRNVFGRPDFGKITTVSGFPRLLQIMVRYAW